MIMKKLKEKYIEEVKNGFQINKGKGSFYCFNKDIIPELVNNIVQTFIAKRDFSSIMIAVDTFETRSSIRKYIDSNITEDTKPFEYNCLSEQYINPNYKYKYDLSILVGVNSNLAVIKHLCSISKFVICILTKNIMDSQFITEVRNILPDIKINVNLNIAKNANIYSPVEEHRHGVCLSDDDLISYRKCNDFISTSVKVFGDISNIEKCKNGDAILNISASAFREQLARENGWSENLDTSIEFHRQIDEIYNPNTLFERACTFYNIVKQRRELVSDNTNKLEEILKICKDNAGKKIIIVSKRGEFAAKITKYINENSTLKCGDYHDCIEDTMLLNDDGSPVLIKSGANKGQPKIIKSKAISSLNLSLFANGLQSILSIKNSSDSKLNASCDILIITSPICDDTIDIKKRFNKITFVGNKTIVYKIYCKDTIEDDMLKKIKPSPLVEIISNNENFIGYDENIGAVVL